MTQQRDTPEGTSRYVPPIGGQSFPDIYQLARPPAVAPVQGSLGGARYAVNHVPREIAGHDNLYHFWVQFYDLRAGMKQYGRIDESHGNWSSSTGLDCRYEQVACLPFLATGATTPTTNSAVYPTIHSAQVFRQVAIAISDYAGLNGWMFTETSSTNPALTAITYSPGSAITSLNYITVANTDYLAVGKVGSGTELLSNLTLAGPTSAATMTTDSNLNYGMIQTALPGRPILMHANASMYSCNATSLTTIAAVPTQTVALCPLGGYALGLASMAGGPVRAYWVMSNENPATFVPGDISGSAVSQTNFRGAVWSCNEYGYDLQELRLPLEFVNQAALIRDGMVATDLNRVIFYNGRVIRDLRIFADPPQNSSRELKVGGFWVRNRTELFAEVNEIAASGASADTRRSVWMYDFDLDCWRQVSTWTTFTGKTGFQSFLGTGQQTGTLPLSRLTNYLHNKSTLATGGTWFRQWQPQPGVNPWSLRHTVGATAGTGQASEASAQWVSTNFDIPGLEGWPKIITRVQGPPAEYIAAGGSGAYMTIAVGDGRTHTFTDTEPTGRFPIDESGYTRSGGIQTIQVTATGYRATTGTDATLYNLNLLPITVEGFCVKEQLSVPSDFTAGQRVDP